MPLDYVLVSLGISLTILASIIPVIIWTKKYHIFDGFWGIGIMMNAIISPHIFQPTAFYAWVPFFLVMLWGIRLSGHLFITRIIPTASDSRYDNLKKKSPNTMLIKQWGLQGGLQAIMVITFYPSVFTTDPVSPSWWPIGGLVVGLMGIVGQAISDYQLHVFKTTKTGICQQGLWQYSRHPNYFFECMIWTGIALSMIHLPSGLMAIIGPVTIFIITYFITGPLTEKASLTRHGQAFKQYQQTTSYFVPLPRRSS